ncbi:hypothetical protein [Spongiactinospora gelatinilytica]|uniref:hypothetical protein n=1 Tax=Spongiactinospora gelatinilytica TaxID=2666298 RepID=UPI0011B935D3|nr:hypothetical protein [Spongiactinospora gelatinilytica]
MVDLTPLDYTERVKEQLDQGAPPLPEIVPGAIGYYFARPNDKNNAAFATLATDKARLSVQLEMGVAGRDSAADVLAMMKLIGPRLISDAETSRRNKDKSHRDGK